MKTMLITGAAGFIGHFLVKQFCEQYKLIVVVRPGGDISRLKYVYTNTHTIEHDLRKPFDYTFDNLDVVLHAGGNPSSEASINDPLSVVMDNVVGTANFLEFSKRHNLKRFVYYGAAESYGMAEKGSDKYESDAYHSVSPYAAAKAGGAELCVAYSETFGLPVSIINVSNTFGPRSQLNRFPVIAINKIMNGEEVSIIQDSDGYISGRRWQHVEDVALQTDFILNNQKGLCEKWNSANKHFINNLEFCSAVAKSLKKDLRCKFVPVDRAGHSSHMSISPLKLYSSGWQEPYSFEERIDQTVKWYTNNKKWL